MLLRDLENTASQHTTFVAMIRSSLLLALASCWTFVASHTVITYPGWRGDNLVTNGTTPDGGIPTGSLGMNWNDQTKSYDFPFGMQWMYPCT